jgi:hypothetical protein
MACFGENVGKRTVFPEKLPNFFWLQHPEFSTKLAQN